MGTQVIDHDSPDAVVDPRDALSAALDDARQQAEELRARLLATEVTVDDLAELADSSVLVSRFLDEVREVLKQLFVAGVAYPDLELPDELMTLSQRAWRHGLAGALEHLLALTAELAALSEASDLFVRADRSAAVWQRAQRLTTWLRLFEQELELSAVQSRLAVSTQASEGRGASAPSSPRWPVATATCWPVGLLTRGATLTIVALDVDTGRQLTLVDELADVSPRGPFAGLVISRLFRQQLYVRQVLSGLIRLEDHPYLESGDPRSPTLVFRPAFAVTPTALPVPRDVLPPALGSERSGTRPYRVPLVVSRDTAGTMQLRHCLSGESTGVSMGPVLRCNLIKLLVRDGVDRLQVDGTLLADGDVQHLIAMSTEDDGRCFPVDDLSLYRLDRFVLARRADADPVETSSCAGLLLRGAAFLYGGASPQATARFRAALAAFKGAPVGVEWLLNVMRAEWGVEMAPASGTLKRALAVMRAAARVKRPTSKGFVSTEGLFAALAALIDHDGLASHGAPMSELAAQLLSPEGGRFAQLNEPCWTEICVRALLMVAARRSGAEAPTDDDSLGVHGGRHERAGEPLDRPGVGAADPGGPLEFLDAHIQGIRPSARQRTRGQPPPDLHELLRLSVTLRALSGPESGRVTLAELDIPWHLVVLPALRALYRWVVELPSAEDPASRHDAAVALLVSARAAFGDRITTS